MSYTDYNANRDDTGDWDFLELEPYKDPEYRKKYTQDIIKEHDGKRFDEMDELEIEEVTKKFIDKGIDVPEYFNEMSQSKIDKKVEDWNIKRKKELDEADAIKAAEKAKIPGKIVTTYSDVKGVKDSIQSIEAESETIADEDSNIFLKTDATLGVGENVSSLLGTGSKATGNVPIFGKKKVLKGASKILGDLGDAIHKGEGAVGGITEYGKAKATQAGGLVGNVKKGISKVASKGIEHGSKLAGNIVEHGLDKTGDIIGKTPIVGKTVNKVLDETGKLIGDKLIKKGGEKLATKIGEAGANIPIAKMVSTGSKIADVVGITDDRRMVESEEEQIADVAAATAGTATVGATLAAGGVAGSGTVAAATTAAATTAAAGGSLGAAASAALAAMGPVGWAALAIGGIGAAFGLLGQGNSRKVQDRMIGARSRK
tara:strand:+ start:9526 stop:10812 length:1287 start_codon:yes stop_codon:yes gene_type:complete